ncbi:hypothetical protein LTR37_004336 [Vermiconidia calcicola]|uniref:Uncharacterized protein n=1 Tax=Vermiconidia calcicola TaxID=1690605 RepID=A0ACC3NMM2_9PEZI|nr:hypothetical protein LTR37_004336 [Vermiconidia calcicola]
MISEVIDKKKISGAKKGTSGGSKIMQAPTWPGFVVKEGEEGFTAMVGSPNVSGVAWLIIQHQSDMGHKTIKSIQIFDEDRKGLGYAPTMILEIGDAKQTRYEGT